ncbi:hypothetical protein MAQ5080_01604 [Marinomonas aquimarina]|uniref:DUF4381 domain-containing protein n=1 Tax=Marinomonas aquimarina TaxID=295068 RepID=A0A1A8TDV4_9GAMM|nr:DUF4381 family protein [Marinomonas aquimarina]SBS30215.1 hypothetical protein MAQ5080_01604 [Marinomonas aquimarina]
MSMTIELPNKAYMLPQAIPEWPPVWWFWLVVAAAILLLALLVFSLVRRHRQRAYRREALAQLSQTQELSDQALIELCLSVIKRCLMTEGKQELVSIPTSELLPILDRHNKRSKIKLAVYEACFTSAIYQPNSQLSADEREALLRVTKAWIRGHRA